MDKNYPGRNEAIVRMYLEERANFQEIANSFGLTRQRVEQIVRGRTSIRHGTSLRQQVRDLKLKESFERVKNGVSTLEDEAASFGLVPDSLLSNWYRRGWNFRTEPVKQHGTRHRYNMGCRCAECTESVRLYQRTLAGREPRQHGTESAYVNYACRCDACKRAGSAHNRKYRERRKQRERLLHGMSTR